MFAIEENNYNNERKYRRLRVHVTSSTVGGRLAKIYPESCLDEKEDKRHRKGILVLNIDHNFSRFGFQLYLR